MIMLSVTFLVATVAGNWYQDAVRDRINEVRRGMKSGRGFDVWFDYTKSDADAPVTPSASNDIYDGPWASAVANFKKNFNSGMKLAPQGGQVSCKDTPGWSDGTNGCVAYAKEGGWCDKYGTTDWNGEGSAADHCCICGGGTWQSCADTPGWSDGNNGCDAYVKHPHWCDQFNLGATGACCICGGGTSKVVEFDAESEVAGNWYQDAVRDRLDEVRRGIRSGRGFVDLATPAAVNAGYDPEDVKAIMSEGMGCKDTPGWSDGFNGCDTYRKYPEWCDAYGRWINDPEKGAAVEHCCICGGGRTNGMKNYPNSESEVASIEAESRKLKEANEQLRTVLRSLVN